MASNLRAMASNLRAMASNLRGVASTLVAVCWQMPFDTRIGLLFATECSFFSLSLCQSFLDQFSSGLPRQSRDDIVSKLEHYGPKPSRQAWHMAISLCIFKVSFLKRTLALFVLQGRVASCEAPSFNKKPIQFKLAGFRFREAHCHQLSYDYWFRPVTSNEKTVIACRLSWPDASTRNGTRAA